LGHFSVSPTPPEEQRVLVQEVLALMLPKERKAWEFQFQGFSIRETAKLMGITRQGIQNLMKRGLRRVRKHLESHEESEDMKQGEKFEIRDIRKKDQFVVDNAYYDGYAKVCGAYASLVYMALCRHADVSRQTCFPSISLIAGRLGISGRQVMRALQVLEDYNIIRRERTLGKGNMYWLIDKKHWKQTSAPQSPTSDYQSPVPVTDSHTKDSHLRILNKDDYKYIVDFVPEDIPFEEIISCLNRQIGTSYRHERPKTRQLIKARWKEGFRLEDFTRVIDNMTAAWGNNPEMQNYLRPETLFSHKFESYLNWKTGGIDGSRNNKARKHGKSGSASEKGEESEPTGKYAGIGEVLTCDE